ncbi:hypothetical protein [Robiginitomaculum antarcticum]|uniref:hypothetical protein n=1 Tax=Robiginitomaculum antarcticum TaxID=437507 RepID=UPI00036C7D37|nr:hypothetical protein [Robiginitomaculum antarcticum]
MSEYDTTTTSKTPWIIGGVVALAVIVGVILLTDIDLTDTGSLPEVNVEGGEMPKVDIDVADVKVGTKKVDVKVPTIDIDLPEEGEEADDLADNIDVDVDVKVEPDQ